MRCIFCHIRRMMARFCLFGCDESFELFPLAALPGMGFALKGDLGKSFLGWFYKNTREIASSFQHQIFESRYLPFPSRMTRPFLLSLLLEWEFDGLGIGHCVSVCSTTGYQTHSSAFLAGIRKRLNLKGERGDMLSRIQIKCSCTGYQLTGCSAHVIWRGF